MNDLFVFAGHNTLVALVLALFVYGLTRDRRNPPLSHVLWLLVHLKLVAPPVMCVDWSALRPLETTAARGQIIVDRAPIEEQPAENDLRFVDGPPALATAQATATSVTEFDPGARVHFLWNRGRLVLLWFWLGGAGLCALVATTRIVRFERLLEDTLPASERLQRLAIEVAGKLGVRRVPCVRYVECVEVPLLWCAGRRPTIVLPLLCCDAWVRSVFPDCTKRYAEVVLETAESLNARRVGARLLPASPFLQSQSLKATIEMILESRFAPRLSSRSMIVIALFAILVIPSFIRTTKIEARAGSIDGTPAKPTQKSASPTTSELPYAVRFDQGATRFANGDEIIVTEVRGTATTFEAGNIYWIKGNYTLASHDRAMLAAYVTATDAENGTGPSLKIQTTVVEKGTGAFTLYLPMLCRGWPHVSFYPTKGGSDFGGNYFGTGDSVLKRWWGSQETD
jgi:beta-lactamase regulating signal transducer with metallopeptidase domain